MGNFGSNFTKGNLGKFLEGDARRFTTLASKQSIFDLTFVPNYLIHLFFVFIFRLRRGSPVSKASFERSWVGATLSPWVRILAAAQGGWEKNCSCAIWQANRIERTDWE